LYRTSRLRAGLPLSQVTGEIATGWGLTSTLLPATDDPIRTRVHTSDGRVLAFQEYFVRERHDVEVASIEIDGIDAARPAPGVLESITGADVILIAPSNPVVSIDPVLAVPGIRDAVAARRSTVVAISPIVGGAALKGPADRLLRDLGHEPTVGGISAWYAPVASTLVIDLEDEAHADEIRSTGMGCVVTDTIMRNTEVSADLAAAAIEAVLP
ncbi:MAG: 2-phospho-L-lactate transferase CofD family protein, partial [Microthrixaceae bacterium]